jgi:D-alanine transaminase
MPRIAYVNGQYVPHNEAAVHIEDRGFQLADSVYEVIACMDGHLADEQGQIDRLERSLKEIRIDMPMPRAAMKLVMRELLRRNRIRNASIYMQVTRGVAARDFAFPKNAVPSFVMTVRPAAYDLAARKASVKKIVTVPDIRWKRRDIKSTALLGQVLARQAAVDKGAYEAWMVDDKGMITEGAASNAWIIDKNNNLLTRPAAQNSILKGVTRSALQALCKAEKIKLVERAFSVKEAYQAKEAFCSSAVALIAPVAEIDGKKIGNGKIGPLTEKLFDLYMDYATDRGRKQEKWNEK